MTTTRRAREAWWFGAIGAAILLAYLRSFTVPFQFDDFVNIVDAPILQTPPTVSFWRFARARILPTASFVLNYRLGGSDPVGYHIVNLAIHLLATLVVYRLVLALCRTPRLRQTWLAAQELPLAIAAAVLFACHPIQVEAVTYVVQRVSSMAALFYVASVMLYVRARNAQLDLQPGRPWLVYGGSVLCALAAFVSKENSATLPFAILLTEFTFYPGATARKRGLQLAPFVGLVLIIPLVWWLFGSRFRGGESFSERVQYVVTLLSLRARPVDQISPVQYFLTQCTVIPRYLRLVVFPWGFNVDHDVPLATGLSGSVVAGLTFLATLLGFGLYALRRWPLVGFGIVWTFLTLSVESSLLPIQDVMVERRMYLAMPGVAIALAVPFVWALCRWRRVVLVGGAVLAAGLCALTFLRNEVWLTPLSLWQDAVDKSPRKVRAHVNLGTAFALDDRLDDAIACYCTALELEPNDRRAESNLQALLEKQSDELPAGRRVILDVLETHPGGSLIVAPPDPCQRIRRKK